MLRPAVARFCGRAANGYHYLIGALTGTVTAAYVDAICRNGNKVQFKVLQGVGHAFVARDAGDEAVSWIAARFDGQPAPRNCKE
jgi:hypothetical protein